MAYTEQELSLLKRLEKKFAASGTFKIEQDAKGALRFMVGGQSFTSAEAAIERAQSLSSYARFTHGSTVMPRTGSVSSKGIEMMLSKMVAAGKTMGEDLTGMSIDRTTLKLKPGLAKQLMDEGITNFNPGKDNVVVWDLFDRNGNKIPAAKRDKLLNAVFDIPNADAKKLFKRFNTILSEEQLSIAHGRPMTAALFTPGKEFGRGLSAAGKIAGFDGLAVLNPNTLISHASKIEEQASELAKQVGEADHAVVTLRKKAQHLRSVARNGGTEETFRALGLVNTKGENIQGMIKGDVFIPPLKKWKDFLTSRGYEEADAARIDILAPADSLTTELGLRPGIGKEQSFMTLKANRTEGLIHQDIQSWIAYGGDLDNPQRTLAYTNRVVGHMQQQWVTEGRLTPGYRDTLERILEEESGATLEQKLRAKRILDWEATGQAPTGDILSEGLRGIEELIKRGAGQKPNDPFLLVEASLGRHIRNLEYMRDAGIIDPSIATGPDELFYRRGYGWGVHEDTLAKLVAAHGGADLDDALRQRLRYDRASNSFVGIGIRSPMSHGEASVLNFDPSKNLGLMEEVLENDPLYAERVRGWGNLETRHSAIRAAYEDADRLINDPDLALHGESLRFQQARRARHAADLDRIRVAQEQARIIAREAFPEVENARAVFDRMYLDESGAWKVKRAESRVDFDEWLRRREAVDPGWEARMRAKKLEDLPVGDYDNVRQWLKEVGASRLTEAQYERLILNESHMNLLERVFNVNTMADSMRRHMEHLGLEGIIPEINPEDIIDPLTQGSGKLNPEDIELRLRAMVQGIADAVGQGAKMSQGLFKERMRSAGGDFWDMVAQVNPAINRESQGAAFLDLNNAEEAAFDLFHQGRLDTRLAYETAAARSQKAEEAFYVPKAIKDKLYRPEEYDAADELYQRFRQAQSAFEKEGVRVGNTDLERMAYGLLNDEESPREKALNVLAHHIQGYFDESGQFTDEGANVLGALLQKHSRRLHGVFQKGGLSDVISFTHQQALGIKDLPRPNLDTFQQAQAMDDLPEEFISKILRPGERRRESIKESFGAASGVLGDFGKEASSAMGHFRRFGKEAMHDLWEIPLFRKGALTAAGLVGFSAIYSKLRDRSPEELEGPALLPGGSFYEHMPDPRTVGLYSQSSATGGSGGTYNVQASGTFNPIDFQSKLRDIVGDAQMTSNYYNGADVSRISRPRYLNKKGP